MLEKPTISTSTITTAKIIFFVMLFTLLIGDQGFQRQEHIHVLAVAGVDIHLHIGKNLGNGFIVHPALGNLRVEDILVIHGLEHGYLLRSLVDSLLLQILGVLQQLVGLGVGFGNLG